MKLAFCFAYGAGDSVVFTMGQADGNVDEILLLSLNLSLAVELNQGFALVVG